MLVSTTDPEQFESENPDVELIWNLQLLSHVIDLQNCINLIVILTFFRLLVQKVTPSCLMLTLFYIVSNYVFI